MTILTYSGTLKVTSCWCGIALAVPDSLLRTAHTGKTSIYCPVGHQFAWRGDDTTEARLRTRLATAERRASNALEREAATIRRLAAAKGQITKAKKRAAAGVCPCCSRSFENVARHVASQHPQFVAPLSSKHNELTEAPT